MQCVKEGACIHNSGIKTLNNEFALEFVAV